VVDPTLVLVYDPQDEGYDLTDQHYMDWPEEPYFQPQEEKNDDVEAEGEDGDTYEDQGGHVVGLPFPGGLEDISLLSKYAKHVALHLWYNTDNGSDFIL